eukprot:2708801-Rhodomonas_salina.1
MARERERERNAHSEDEDVRIAADVRKRPRMLWKWVQEASVTLLCGNRGFRSGRSTTCTRRPWPSSGPKLSPTTP